MLGHVHVFGALHVPPFEQVGEQTAKRNSIRNISEITSVTYVFGICFRSKLMDMCIHYFLNIYHHFDKLENIPLKKISIIHINFY